MIIGYTSGVFDLFHVGHLNLLEKAKKECDFLVVAVCTDDFVVQIKGHKPIIKLEDRLRILSALCCVDRVIVKGFDKEYLLAKSVNADIVFKGSDWEKSKKWLDLKKRFGKEGIRVKFFPYTEGISSTKLRSVLNG